MSCAVEMVTSVTDKRTVEDFSTLRVLDDVYGVDPTLDIARRIQQGIQEIEEGQRSIEWTCELKGGYTDGQIAGAPDHPFALFKFQKEMCISGILAEYCVKSNSSMSKVDEDFCGLSKVTLEDFYPYVEKMRTIFSTVTTVFRQQYSKISLCRSFLRLKSLSGD